MLSRRTGQRGGHERAVFTCASAQALPYAPESFDVVITTAAFHHFPRPDQALCEFLRVLRQGGCAIIADSCRDLSLGAWMWDRLHRWFEPGHVMYYRRDELSDLIRRAGFTGLTARILRPTYAETRKLVRPVTIFSARKP